MLPSLQCACKLHKSPLAQRPVEFYIDKVQFGLKEPRVFVLGFAASKPPLFAPCELGKREAAAGQCPHGVQVPQHRQTDLQPCWCHCWCGSVLLPPLCLTFNYPWCCECNTDLFVQLVWDKRAILWAGRMGTTRRFHCGRMKHEGCERSWGLFQTRRRSTA